MSAANEKESRTPRYYNMKVAELRERCKVAGLDPKGRKDELIERLKAADKKPEVPAPRYKTREEVGQEIFEALQRAGWPEHGKDSGD